MHKAEIVLVMILVAHHHAAEVLQPRKQPLHFPSPLVSPSGRPSCVGAFFRFGLCGAIISMPASPSSSSSGSESYALSPINRSGLLVGKTLSDSLCDKSDFMRRSRRRVDGERKTRAVCHRHELRTLAPLGLSHSEPPFLATTNVPSIKHSDRSSSPRCLRSSASASSTLRSVPSRHPLLESAMAGLVRRESLGQVLPACAAAQNPENAVQDFASIFPRSATSVFAARRWWNQRLDDCPLFIG